MSKMPKGGRPGSKKAARQEPYVVSSLDRAFDVLEAFSEARPELSLMDIVAATGLHKATAFRLLSSLRKRHVIAKDERTGRYHLGFRLVGLADIAKAHNAFIGQARAAMVSLRDETLHTVYLSVRRGDHRFDIEQILGLTEPRLSIPLGQAKLLEAGAAGRVMLAALSDGEVDDYLARTEAVRLPDTDVAALRRDIARVRQVGYGESSRQVSLSAVSTPVLGPGNEFLCTISIILPVDRYERDHTHMAETLRDRIRRLSRELGAT
jgi:DNA-binding IclR family transcriptional regulator